MRRVICLFKGHVPEAISPVGLTVIPTVGLVSEYVVDPDGAWRGCQRCRLILPEEKK